VAAVVEVWDQDRVVVQLEMELVVKES